MLHKLEKLKKITRAELAERSLQGAKILVERALPKKKDFRWSDRKFIASFNNGAFAVQADLVSYFRRKITNFPMFDGFRNRLETLYTLQDKFPHHQEFILEKAEQIINGKFDLLGYQNLSFGNPPKWHFDPILQKFSPKTHWSKINEVNSAQTGDKKIIWELNRHQYFAVLGQAYFYTGDEKYAAVFAEHLRDWLSQNPYKIGVNWLSSLELAFRSMSWLWAIHFFINSPHLTDSLLFDAIKSLYRQGLHIEDFLSTFFSPNTHITGEALGLILLGEFFYECPRGKIWIEKGSQILFDEFEKQVRRDGTHVEQSTHYQRYTTEFYLHFLMFLRRAKRKIPDDFEEKLQKMGDFLQFAASPDGTTEPLADDDGGRFLFLDEAASNDFRPTLNLCAYLFERADFAFGGERATAEIVWLGGAEGLRKLARTGKKEPSEKIRLFADGGFCTMRGAWTRETNFLLIDGGAHGFLNGGHAHADALHFVAMLKGKRIFIDSGTYNYTSDAAARKYFRSTAAHNCLTVDGADSSVSAGAFSWKTMTDAQMTAFEHNADGAVWRGTHKGFEHLGVDYEREFRFSNENEIFVADKIFAAEHRTFALNFHLAPNVEIGIDFEISCEVLMNEGRKEILPTVEECEISPRYGAKRRTKKLIFVHAGAGEICFLTRFRGC